MTDIDHDGFDWGDARFPFAWENNRRRYPDLEAFSAAIGIERRGIRVRKEEIFENYAVPDRRARVEPFTLALRAGPAAIDAGVPVPNLVEDFAGRAPDLGAQEHGEPPAHNGPRPAGDSKGVDEQ